MKNNQSFVKIQRIRASLSKQFAERDALIDGMLVALLAREHLFMLGPPGTAKSLISETVCGVIKGEYFSWLMTKFTTPEEIYGPYSLKSLENDKYERVVAGKLPTAQIAFLDEIFKGSSAILNTLLKSINERVYFNGTNALNIPLQVLFGASNEIPTAQELAALYDRFTLRYMVEPIKSDRAATALFAGFQAVTHETLTLAELAELQKLAANVVVPDAVIEKLLALRKEMRKLNIYVSDRKWVQATKALKAYALLNGVQEVEADHLSILEHVLWNSPEQIKQVRKVVAQYTDPMSEKIAQLVDSIQEVWDRLESQVKEETQTAIEGHATIKAAIKKLEELGDAKRLPKLAKAIAEAKAIHLEVCKKYMGID